jgi:hypothetical protein
MTGKVEFDEEPEREICQTSLVYAVALKSMRPVCENHGSDSRKHLLSDISH